MSSSLSERLVALASRLLPAGQRDWAEAMMAELPLIPSRTSRACWAFGCLWAIFRLFSAGSDGKLARTCLLLLTSLAILDWSSAEPAPTLVVLVIAPGVLAYLHPTRHRLIGVAFGMWLLALHALADLSPGLRPHYQKLPLSPSELLEIAMLLAATVPAAAIGAWSARRPA